MKNIFRLVKLVNIPTKILDQIPISQEVSAFNDKYRDHLSALPKITNIEDLRQHSLFPYANFKRFPKETMEKIIDDSFQIIKEKVDLQLGTTVYNMLMSNYLQQYIEFDIKALLKEMIKRNVPFDESTYKMIIDYYSEIGEMKTVENFVTTLNSKGIEIKKPIKISIIKGYIISGQKEKMNQFMKDNFLNENDFDVLIGQCQGYATIGDTNKLISVINVMKDKGFEYEEYNMQFYLRLAASNELDSKVEEFRKLFLPHDDQTRITLLIYFLNRNGYYNKSLKYAEKYHDVLKDHVVVHNILNSFNSTHCPNNVYISVLKLFVNELGLLNKNLFQNMTFDEAFQISQKLCNAYNRACLGNCLQDKAISDKSVQNLKKALEFTITKLRWSILNSRLLFGFIPNMLKSGMVSDSKALLELLPEYKKFIFPSVLMHHLLNGEFAEYNSLISKSPIQYKLSYSLAGLYLGSKKCRIMSLKELDNFAMEASKVFNETAVANILTNYVSNLISNNVKTRKDIEPNEISRFVEKFRLYFRMEDIIFLKKTCSDYSKFFDSLPIRSESPRMELEKSTPDEAQLNQESSGRY